MLKLMFALKNGRILNFTASLKGNEKRLLESYSNNQQQWVPLSRCIALKVKITDTHKVEEEDKNKAKCFQEPTSMVQKAI